VRGVGLGRFKTESETETAIFGKNRTKTKT